MASRRAMLLLASTIAVLLLLLPVLARYYQPGTVVEGVVAHKTVVGVRDGSAVTVLRIIDGHVLVKDELLKQQLHDTKDGKTLDEILELVRQWYDTAYCTISVRLVTDDPLNRVEAGETMAYMADLEYCAAIDVGSRIRFVVSVYEPLRMDGIDVVEPPPQQ